MGIEEILNGSNPSELKKLIALLQNVVDLAETDNTDNQKKNQDTSDEYEATIKSRSSGKKTRDKPFVNKFLNMPEKDMHKEDIEFDKKVSKMAPVPRNRSFEPIRVTCRICGKKEEVNPALVDSIQRYKCNNCSTQAG